MTATGPGFLDEEPRPAAHSRGQPEVGPDDPTPGLARRPVLLDPERDAPTILASSWKPAHIRHSTAAMGSVAWIASGLAVLLLCWMIFACVSVALSLASRSNAVGLGAGLCMAAGGTLILYGLATEWRSYRRLRRVDSLRATLTRMDQPVEAARMAALAWVRHIAPALPHAGTVDQSLLAAASQAEVAAILRSRVTEPLRMAAEQLGRRAALEGAGLIAISPHASWDGVIAGLRGLLVIRQVASLYGLRPGPAVSLVLVRKVAATAVGTAGIELLSRSLADHVFSTLPVARHIAGALPGTSVAALRLYRLAKITAAACSPVPV